MSKIITRSEWQGGGKWPGEILYKVEGGGREVGREDNAGGITKIYALSKGGSINLMRPNVGRATPASNREVEEATTITTRINTGRSHSESIKAKSLSPSKNSRRFVSLFRLKVFNVVAVA